MKSNKSKISCKQGFNLIELLVVVLIIGILAAVALPQYKKAVVKSRYMALKPLVKALVRAEEAYYLINGTYAADVEQLDVNFPDTPTGIQENNSGEKSYTFDWGECSLNVNTALRRVVCKDENTNITYAILLQHITNQLYVTYAGKQRCGPKSAEDENATITQICQTESGLLTPNRGVYFYW